MVAAGTTRSGALALADDRKSERKRGGGGDAFSFIDRGGTAQRLDLAVALQSAVVRARDMLTERIRSRALCGGSVHAERATYTHLQSSL